MSLRFDNLNADDFENGVTWMFLMGLDKIGPEQIYQSVLPQLCDCNTIKEALDTDHVGVHGPAEWCDMQKYSNLTGRHGGSYVKLQVFTVALRYLLYGEFLKNFPSTSA